MRTLYGKILLWSLGTLLVVMAGLSATSYYLAYSRSGDGVSGMTAFQLEGARGEFEAGGAPRLAAYLAKLNQYFPAVHHLLDAAGRDLVTGEDRSRDLGEARQPSRFRSPIPSARPFRIVRSSADQKYRLLAIVQPRFSFTSVLPYYLWTLGAVMLLGYVLALRLVSPLRRLHHTVERFGGGDLSSRLRWKRRDEIGEVGRAFDQMAERIVTLLTAERRLLQDVSHELRSPLARLGFAVELARTSADREAAWDRIRKEVERLTELVNELLQLTQAEGDPAARELREVQLEPLLRETVDDCEVEAKAQGRRVVLESSAPVVLYGDARLLRRAIENVLRNGVRHAPEGSKIEVKLELRENTAAIHVRDFGPGVPDELLPEIFKPFFRVEGDRSRQNGGGVGLGLSITQRAVHLHNGRLWAENASPGLRVVIELPTDGPATLPAALAPAHRAV